jgi:hypothetical protein
MTAMKDAFRLSDMRSRRFGSDLLVEGRIHRPKASPRSRSELPRTDEG